MADRIRRLGGDRGGAEGHGGPVRRRPIHGAGQERGGRVGVRIPSCPGGAADRMDRAASSSRTTSLDTTRGFTRPRPSRDIRPPARKRAPSLIPVDYNPIDAIWPDRPPAAVGRDHAAQAAICGRRRAKKIARVRQALGSSQGLLISDPHNLAWLFNIRGSDVSYTPLPIGWAYLPLEGRPVVFLDGRKLAPASRQSLSSPSGRARA